MSNGATQQKLFLLLHLCFFGLAAAQGAHGGGGFGGGGRGGGGFHGGGGGHHGGGEGSCDCSPVVIVLAIVLPSVLAILLAVCMVVVFCKYGCCECCTIAEIVDTAQLRADAAAWVLLGDPSSAGHDRHDRPRSQPTGTRINWPSGIWRGWYEQDTRKHLLPDFALEFGAADGAVGAAETARLLPEQETAGESTQQPESSRAGQVDELRGHGNDDVGAYVIEGGFCSSIVISLGEAAPASRLPPRVAFVKRYLLGGDDGGRRSVSGDHNLNLGHSLVYQGEVVAGWLEVDLGAPSSTGGGATSDGQSSTFPRRGRKLLVPNLTQGIRGHWRIQQGRYPGGWTLGSSGSFAISPDVNLEGWLHGVISVTDS